MTEVFCPKRWTPVAKRQLSSADACGCAHTVLAACIHEAGVELDEESWFLLRAVLHVLLASKPHPRALKNNAAAATEAGVSRAASLLKAYREISSQELPSTAPIHLALLLFEVRPVLDSCCYLLFRRSQQASSS